MRGGEGGGALQGTISGAETDAHPIIVLSRTIPAIHDIDLDGLTLRSKDSDQSPDPCSKHQWNTYDPTEAQCSDREQKAKSPDDDLTDSLARLAYHE